MSSIKMFHRKAWNRDDQNHLLGSFDFKSKVYSLWTHLNIWVNSFEASWIGSIEYDLNKLLLPGLRKSWKFIEMEFYVFTGAFFF